MKFLIFTPFLFSLIGCVPRNSKDSNSLIKNKKSTSLEEIFSKVEAEPGPNGQTSLTLDHFLKSNLKKDCVVRSQISNLSVTDFHYHAKSFGTRPMSFQDSVTNLKKSGVLFVMFNGIGQRLFEKKGSFSQTCQYYGDCPGTYVWPDSSSDLSNAEDYLSLLNRINLNHFLSEKPSTTDANRNKENFEKERLELAKKIGLAISLSMTAFDLADPFSATALIDTVYQKNYSNLFVHAGELNLVKQAIFPNGHVPTKKNEIEGWKPMMEFFLKNDMALSIHSDLGWDTTQGALNADSPSSKVKALFDTTKAKEPEKYVDLMKYALEKYPKNKIVWLHFGGLSKQLIHREQNEHLAMLRSFLNKFPNLYLDIAWTVLNDFYFSKEKEKQKYVDFINEYSTRILAGTDFVAAENKNYEIYKSERLVTNSILKTIDDKAFRNIVLGQNYLNLVPGLGSHYEAPILCP